MDTARYAKPDCKICHGRGRVKTGEHIGEVAICLCAIAGQRQAHAERIIDLKFPGIVHKMTLENFNTGGKAKNEQALTVGLNFIDHYEEACKDGWIVGFWGLPSAGKTHLAVAIAQECVRRYLAKPMIFNVPKELRRERERFRRYRGREPEENRVSPIDRAMQAELLILDDLGSEYHRTQDDPESVSWVMEQLYQILDERIMQCRPTIVTSNFSPSDLERQFSSEAAQRVLSRIQRAMVVPLQEVVVVPGANRQDKQDAAKLFAKREDIKEDGFAVRDERGELDKRYSSKPELVSALRDYVQRHGRDEVQGHVRVKVLRGGHAARELDIEDLAREAAA